MPTPSDTIEQSQTLPTVPTDISNPLNTTQCPPETRSPPRANLGEDHGLLDLPTPPHGLPTTNTTSMPRADDDEQSISTTSQQSLDRPDIILRDPQRIVAGIAAQPGSTEVSNGVTNHAGRPFISLRESHGGSIQESTAISESLDSLRLLEAARQEESEILPNAADTRPRGPSLFQSLSRRRNFLLENSQGVPSASSGNSVPRYAHWPATSDIPPALYEPTRAQLHRSERSNLQSEAAHVEEILRSAYQRLQDQSGTQQPTSERDNARPADRGDTASMRPRNTFSRAYDLVRSRMNQDMSDVLTIEPTISSHRADILACPPRRSERKTNADLSGPTTRYPRQTMSRATKVDRPARKTPPSSTPTSTPNHSSGPPNPVLPGHNFGRYQPSSLHAGSVFVGTQCSDRQEYNVKVEIKHVDMDDSFLCGHLIIEGLTQDHPKLETYFEAEIIGDKYEFATRHPDWGSSEKQDMLHWNRFAAWKRLYRPSPKQLDINSRENYKDFAEHENIFMRWKEYFLVPDHRVTAISGASFEGFYYICFNQKRASFSGIYYHAKSERWQQLELKHVPGENGGCMPAVELA